MLKYAIACCLHHAACTRQKDRKLPSTSLSRHHEHINFVTSFSAELKFFAVTPLADYTSYSIDLAEEHSNI
eukprot:scaffold70260_cov34-Prasinocladus_malaysianus.AAC.1